jgi:hypothetical protein
MGSGNDISQLVEKISYTNGNLEWTVLIDFGMNMYNLYEINCPNEIHSK